MLCYSCAFVKQETNLTFALFGAPPRPHSPKKIPFLGDIKKRNERHAFQFAVPRLVLGL